MSLASPHQSSRMPKGGCVWGEGGYYSITTLAWEKYSEYMNTVENTLQFSLQALIIIIINNNKIKITISKEQILLKLL